VGIDRLKPAVKCLRRQPREGHAAAQCHRIAEVLLRQPNHVLAAIWYACAVISTIRTFARPAAEALRVALRGRLHIRDTQGEMRSPHGSPLKIVRGGGGQKSSMSQVFCLYL
jgi:hypothetical protein